MATIADELNAISVEHGYTGAAPKTIAGAIDALADTLAGTDVEERRTIAGAVKALAPYIGSGGGATLGALQAMPRVIISPPSVGRVLDSPHSLEVADMRVGSQAVFSNPYDNPVFTYTAAAGVTVVAYDSEASDIEDISTYLATGTENDGDITVETLEEFDLDVSVDINHGTISFVMPDLNAEEGQFPIMYIRRSFS